MPPMGFWIVHATCLIKCLKLVVLVIITTEFYSQMDLPMFP